MKLRVVLAALLLSALLPPSRASAGWQKDEVCQGRCGGGCGPCPASGGGAAVAPPVGAGFTPQQQLMLGGAMMLGQGISNALRGDPQAEAARRARESALAEQRRQAAQEQRRQDQQTKDRLLGEMLGVDASSHAGEAGAQPAGQAPADDGSLRLLADDNGAGAKDARANDPRFKSPSFSKGYDAAQRCSTQNAGSACADVSGAQAERCILDYRAGYEAGQKEQAAMLQRAMRKGAGAAMSGLQDDAASDPDSEGDCRTQWVEAYHRGYFQAAHSGADKR